MTTGSWLDVNRTDRRLKGLMKKSMKLSEFVDQCRKLIPLFAGKQVRYQVSDFPDERTIRYYVQEGLIDRPTRHGRNVVFSYRHLLQVIAIKRLQTEYLPLRKIAEITREFDNSQLETLLYGAGTQDRALLPALLESSVSKDAGVIASPTTSAPGDGLDWTPPDRPEWSSVGPGWTFWQKFKIHEYLELHVDERFSALDPTVDIERIVARLMNVISMLSAQSSDRAIPDQNHSDLFDTPDSFYVSAAPVKILGDAVVALITEGGLVPKGNPDRLESAKATRYLKYSISGASSLEEETFESVDRGWDTTYVNEDPNRLLPLDVMRELERKRIIGKTHKFFYTTTGVATTVDVAKKIGKGIASELKRQEVSAAILTAT